MAQTAAPPGGAEETIFVSIASYRDPECQYTIRDLFSKARHPNRIVVGACLQVAEEDDSCFLIDLGRWSDQIRTMFLRHTEAKGPCYARSLIQEHLYLDEDYYCQIDSHFRFVQDWDEVAIHQLRRCPSAKPLLTSHVASYTLPKEYAPGGPDQAVLSPMKSPTVMCADTFGDATRDDNFLRVKSRTARMDFGGPPLEALFWTARFSFSRGDVVREVPYDPHQEYIFFGEEIAQAARLWTHGWDMFNPTENLAYHITSRAHRPWFREVEVSPDQVRRERDAKLRICGLLATHGPDGESPPPPPEAPYGLGTKRSLAEYERFAGVSFSTQTVTDRARSGGLGVEHLPPAWAEEMREAMLHAQVMKDPEAWAGKNNAAAKERLFQEAPAVQEHRPEVDRARDLTGARIGSLQAQLQALDGGAAAQTECELGRAFIALARLEAGEGNERQASEAHKRALLHAEFARSRADEAGVELRGTAEYVAAVALIGLRRFGEAKVVLREAIACAIEALSIAGGDTAEQLAHDILSAVHMAHEQTDDRAGLVDYVPSVRGLLVNLRRSAGEEPPAAIPILAHSEAPPPEGSASSVRARLLELAVLICIATGRQEDQAVAQHVFTHFSEGRESPNMRRLLGMLQSSGSFLGL